MRHGGAPRARSDKEVGMAVKEYRIKGAGEQYMKVTKKTAQGYNVIILDTKYTPKALVEAHHGGGERLRTEPAACPAR